MTPRRARRAKRAPIVRRFASIILGLGCIWIVLLILWGDRLRYSGYIHAGGVWWAVLVLMASALLMWARAFSRAIAAAALGILVLSYDGWLIPDRGAAPSAAAGSRFRLVTASLRTINDDMESAATVLSSYAPDVLVVQEIEAGDRERFLEIFRSRTDGDWHAAHLNNELIVSRWKPSEVGSVAGILRVRLESPFGGFWLWNVHAPKDYGDLAQIDRYFDALCADIAGRGAGIAAGDFNATPWNDSYRSLTKMLDDAYRRGAWGPGLSFPTRARRLGGLGPFVRIDHVFASPEFVASDAFVGAAIEGSDHFPVVVDLAFVG